MCSDKLTKEIKMLRKIHCSHTEMYPNLLVYPVTITSKGSMLINFTATQTCLRQFNHRQTNQSHK